MKKLASMSLLAVALCGCFSGPQWKRQSFAFARPEDPPAPASTNVVSLGRVSISPLYQSRMFTYRTGENTYEQDPYAGFLIAPDRALAEALRWEMGAFGRMAEPGSAVASSLVAEVSINELYGDFRQADQLRGTMTLHFVVYGTGADGPGQIVFDKVCSRASPMARKTPAALMGAWEADLKEIMQQVSSEYAQANSHDSGR